MKRLMDTHEVARRWDVKPHHVGELFRQGLLPAIRGADGQGGGRSHLYFDPSIVQRVESAVNKFRRDNPEYKSNRFMRGLLKEMHLTNGSPAPVTDKKRSGRSKLDRMRDRLSRREKVAFYVEEKNLEFLKEQAGELGCAWSDIINFALEELRG